MKKPNRPRNKAVGIISPERMYTAGALLRHGGFGPERLYQMRASGIVKPIDIGNYRWYRGDQVVEWMLSLQKQDNAVTRS